MGKAPPPLISSQSQPNFSLLFNWLSVERWNTLPSPCAESENGWGGSMCQQSEKLGLLLQLQAKLSPLCEPCRHYTQTLCLMQNISIKKHESNNQWGSIDTIFKVSYSRTIFVFFWRDDSLYTRKKIQKENSKVYKIQNLTEQKKLP